MVRFANGLASVRLGRSRLRLMRISVMQHCSSVLFICMVPALVVFSLGPASYAQTIHGVVVHDSTYEEVAGARVELLDHEGRSIGLVLTDPAGLFTLQCEAGRYSFRVSKLGTMPAITNEFSFPSDSTRMEVTILLSAEPTAIVLPEVAVEAEAVPRGKMRGFFRRQLEGSGHFVTREMIETYNPRVFTDIMRHVPGVSVSPAGFGRGNIMTMRVAGLGGACAPLVFLDGVLMPRDEFPDTYLRPRDVEGIEVYKGGATTPARFNVMASACCVVVVWTR
jgi:hypothetical protein